MPTGARRADLRTDPYGQIAAVETDLARRARGRRWSTPPAGWSSPAGSTPTPTCTSTWGRPRSATTSGRARRRPRWAAPPRSSSTSPPAGARPPSTPWPTWQGQAEAAAIDYGFHLTLVDHTDEAVIAGCIEQGITSFKLYMAYPETLQVDDDVIVDVLGLRRPPRRSGHRPRRERRRHHPPRAPGPGRGATAPIEHALTRPPEVEGEATARAAGPGRAGRGPHLRRARELGAGADRGARPPRSGA